MTNMQNADGPVDLEVTSKKIKRKNTSRSQSNVTDVVAKGELATTDNPFAEQLAVLKRIHAKNKTLRNEKTIAKLVSEGQPVYTHSEVAKLFPGVKVDPNWDQDRLQWVVKIGRHVHPLLQLREQAAKLTKQHIEPGRKGEKKLMATAYKAYLDATASPDRAQIIEQLRVYLRARKITTHKDAPDASIIVRTVFGDFDSKKAHTYGKSLEYAKENQIAVDYFVTFVDESKGFEKIRTLALKTEQKVDLQIEQDNTKVAENRTRDILEFRRTEPVIKLELTLDQYVQLKPNVTVSTPDKNMDMVVLLAEMDPIDFKMCNIYGTVPMTAELRKTIEKTLSEFIIFDADFAERFYAWKDNKAPAGPKKNAKERMTDIVAKAIKRSTERESAKSEPKMLDGNEH